MSVTDKDIFDKFRQMAGGSLTQEQVDGLNAVIRAGQRQQVIDMFAIYDDVYMTTSLEGMALIAGFEGYKDKAYLDGAGVWTIGFGTTVYPDGSRVKKGDSCTYDQAIMWKKHAIAGFEKAVNEIITVPMKQNQFDALVSLTYNIGATAFHKSSIDDLINAGKTSEALEVWAKYRNIRNPKTNKLEVSKGLVNRRTAEIEYFKR